MLRKIVFLFLVSFFAFSCTKKPAGQNKEKNQFVNFLSEIQYQEKNLSDKSTAATLDGNEISWAQLEAGDAALESLQERYDHQALAFAYAWAAQLPRTSGNNKMKVFMAAPKIEIAKILEKANIEATFPELEIEYSPDTTSPALATLAPNTVKWSEFNDANIQHSRMYERLFHQRMQRLNGIVIRRLLLEASQAQKLSMEEFVQKNILTEKYVPTDQEIKQFAADKNIVEQSLDENMMKRLKDILIQRDREKKIETYVAKNLIKGPVQIGFKSPVVKISQVEQMKGLPQWGSESKAKMMFVGHWDCRGCDSVLKSYIDLSQRFGENIEGTFLYSFPDVDRKSRMGAEAALCVEDQAAKGFWTFLTKVLEVQEEDVEKRINLAAKDSGINFDEFRDCFLKRTHKKKVDTHLAFAKKIGVTQAPLVLFNGHVLQTPVDESEISEKLDEMGLANKAHKKGFFARILAFFGF